ncbi:MAG: DNA-processing protein DprA [Candidatus Lokiarchaeota archaeon]|nr:DNA-processing protein DprA [Candidatus Harpocratesius repetitus]
MLVESLNDSQFRNLVDFIYLRRILKFSLKGLIILFKNPSMEISKFKEFKEDRIKHFLLMGKQIKLDTDKELQKLFSFDFSDVNYRKIEYMVKFCIKHNISIITPNSQKIPLLFQEIPTIHRDLIFIKGIILETDIKSYSICGTRNPSQDAIEKTRRIGAFFAEKGFTLINGFAKGIDIESFKGAQTKKGRYIGVLASGVENVYPPENQKYIDSVINHGALISQRLIDRRVNRQALQMRNRFSAQLSLASIFIEGNYKSGTKWQFKFAREANKPVFYLEPKDWNHENSYIPRMIKEQGGFEIKNDLSNLNKVLEILENEYNQKRSKILHV